MKLSKSKRVDLPDLRLLQAFDQVVQLGSFSSAASHLRVSTSSVSQALSQLETLLAHELIDRTERPVKLTDFGRRFLPLAQELLQAARQHLWHCENLLRKRQQEIRIGCVDSFAATVGPDLVKSLAQQASNVVMHSGITPEVLKHLLRHDIDIAICTSLPTQDSGLYSVPICQESWVVASDPRLRWPKQLSWALLSELSEQASLIRYSQRSIIGEQIDQFLAHARLSPARRFEFDATDSLLSLVHGNSGWAVTSPLCLLQSLHHAQRLTISSLPSSALGHRSFYLLCRAGADQRLADELAKTTRQILATITRRKIAQELPEVETKWLQPMP